TLRGGNAGGGVCACAANAASASKPMMVRMRSFPKRWGDFSILAPPMRIPWIGLAVVIEAALAATSTAHAAPQPPAFRLRDAATPIEYTVRLAIDPREPRLSGEVRIALRINRASPVRGLNATNRPIHA